MPEVVAMARGQGSTTFAKILLRMVDAPARLKIDGSFDGWKNLGIEKFRIWLCFVEIYADLTSGGFIEKSL